MQPLLPYLVSIRFFPSKNKKLNLLHHFEKISLAKIHLLIHLFPSSFYYFYVAVHIIGDRDPVKRMTNHLIEAFDNPLVINHSRGHVIPPLVGEDLAKLRKFLEDQREKVTQQQSSPPSSTGISSAL
jgi:hypothetical protein